MIKGITMQPQSLKLTIRLNRKKNRVNDSAAPNHPIRMEGEPNILNSSILGSNLETTPQDPFSSKDIEAIQNVEMKKIKLKCSKSPSRVLSAVGTFAIQYANYFKWRHIPSKTKYEEIREHTEQTFLCAIAREWRSDVACDDPTDLMQDESRLWAIDKPNISQPPRGWERLLKIRGEGSTKFADR
ncbi:methyl- -binding domain-containing 2 [Olea europaea subsp. europaea]|uniref:Methyl- -binding domain-containing 2 n=1 Tax=Olea europaea subsp. europaea TaxID=158383 RepID=A0A8S0RMB1_OLEEU|nr:methyl- -binding domain-containing 2 [Olea europaea subsp. europaea]